MVSVVGKRMLGKVDRVPGLFYVSTKFVHINLLPVGPVKSYVVLEGSEGYDVGVEGSEEYDTFEGKVIPLQPRSWIAGYVRGWMFPLVLAATVFAVSLGAAVLVPGRVEPVAMLGLLLGFLIGAGLIYVMVFWGRASLVAQALFHLASGLAAAGGIMALRKPEYAEMNMLPVLFLVMLGIANFALLAYGLTHLVDHASYERAQWLGEQLDIPPSVIARHFIGRGARPPQPVDSSDLEEVLDVLPANEQEDQTRRTGTDVRIGRSRHGEANDAPA